MRNPEDSAQTPERNGPPARRPSGFRIAARRSLQPALLVVLACGLFTGVAPARAERRPTGADLVAPRDLAEVRISPDGATVAFVVATVDLEANRVLTRLVTVPAAGGDVADLVPDLDGISNVRWSPDGTRLAFLASDGAGRAVWIVDAARRTRTRVCAYDRGNAFVTKAGNWLAWSPDGTRLAFAGTTEPRPPVGDPVVVTRLQYKTRTDLADNRHAHLFVVPAAGGAVTPLTTGDFDEHSIDWGGSGAEIVFLSNRERDPDANLNYDVFAIDVATRATRRLTATPGVELEPRVSPDGRHVTYIATTRSVTTIDSVAEDVHLFVVPLAGGPPRELNHALDRRTSGPDWTADSAMVLFSAADHGRTALYRARVDGGTPVALVNENAQLGSFSASRKGDVVAYASSSPTAPAEVFVRGADGRSRQLTHVNTDIVRGWTLVTPVTLHFKSADGLDIEGWFYPAAGAGGASGRAPMLLSIHGGPHGMWGYAFNPTFQIQAARGYATLAINPRGSSGYGQRFADGCVGDWGGGDYRDLMAGVDHVLATRNDVDPARLGVLGSSYGGFMTNWVITQTTRFKAAVSGASLSNLISFYSTSLYQDLVHTEFNGFPWDGDNFALLWKWSPLAHVKGATTPTMFVHGERDNDVHITQAEEMYTALRRRGVEAALVRYPREGHGFTEPRHQVDRVERTLAWFDRFLAPPSTPSAAR